MSCLSEIRGFCVLGEALVGLLNRFWFIARYFCVKLGGVEKRSFVLWEFQGFWEPQGRRKPAPERVSGLTHRWMSAGCCTQDSGYWIQDSIEDCRLQDWRDCKLLQTYSSQPGGPLEVPADIRKYFKNEASNKTPRPTRHQWEDTHVHTHAHTHIHKLQTWISAHTTHIQNHSTLVCNAEKPTHTSRNTYKIT